jgi:quercetin dioxygenase-like cupin family protein
MLDCKAALRSRQQKRIAGTDAHKLVVTFRRTKEKRMKYNFAHKLTFVIITALAVSTAAGAAVFLTPGSGIIAAPVVARASFADPTDIKLKVKDGRQEVINAPNARDTVVQQIRIGPNGHTGWHSHPGPVVVLVKSGTLSFYDGDDLTCTQRTYSAGQAFVDRGQGHVHIARNESSTQELELWATYFDVPPPPPPPAPQNNFRIDVPAPGNCPF